MPDTHVTITGNLTDDPEVTFTPNGAAVTNADGSVTVVVARDRLAHPNAVSTCDHAEGALALRWFLAEHVPTRPDVELVRAKDTPTTPT